MGDGHEIFDLTGTVVAIKKRFMLPRLLVFTVLATVPACSACGGPTEPIPAAQADRHVRRPVDEVGYTHTAEGIAEVVEFALGAEQHRFAENNQLRGVGPDDVFAAGISPHDDYQYAQQVYAHLYPHIRASHVLVIGVAHKARDFPEVEGKLVFDSFDAWHGPYGDVEISPLRAELLEALEPGGNAIVHDELQSIEHSVEGLIPWLQHFDRQVQIVSILIPYMSWERMAELADRTAAHLQRAMEQRGMILGRDVAITSIGSPGVAGSRYRLAWQCSKRCPRAPGSRITTVCCCATAPPSIRGGTTRVWRGWASRPRPACVTGWGSSPSAIADHQNMAGGPVSGAA
jgi:AmmeMemoRadiSam system protein B